MSRKKTVVQSSRRRAQPPTQPLVYDRHRVLRFKKNRIVEVLLASGSLDMNKLAVMEFPDADRVQFAQLIGYSLSGFSELSYVSDRAYDRARREGLKR